MIVFSIAWRPVPLATALATSVEAESTRSMLPPTMDCSAVAPLCSSTNSVLSPW